MHILITTFFHYCDFPGGIPRLTHDEAEFLAAAGHCVSIIGTSVEPGAPEVEQKGNVRLLRYKLPDFHLADPRRVTAHQKAARTLLHKHVDAPVHIIHGHVPLTYLAACDVFEHQARTVYTLHSPSSMEMEIEWAGKGLGRNIRRRVGLPLLKRMERRCLERSAAITSMSDFTRRQINRIHGAELADRIQVIPGWVDLERFQIVPDRAALKQALGWPQDVPVFFTLRRLVRRMGLDRLVRAVSILRARGQKLQLVIGGAGPLRRELEELVQALNLSDSVRFLGRVADADLPGMYAACDAFILPTAELECFGLIALEAFACGRPVLATPVAAIPEVMSNFEEQWLAAAADEGAIADLIGAYLSGKLPAHSPENLRRRTEELYSQDDHLAQLSAVLFASPASAPVRAMPALANPTVRS